MPVARRLCEGCELPLPTDSHPNRRYHDEECARVAHRRADDVLGRQATLMFPGPRSGANARSGMQVPFLKAQVAVAEELARHDVSRRTGVAVLAALASALPDRQRARLEGRDL